MSLFAMTIPARDLQPGMTIQAREHRGDTRTIRTITPVGDCLIVDYQPMGGRTYHPDEQVTLA